MEQTVYITKGLPASGKSTWANNLILDGPGTLVRINNDDIREELGINQKNWNPKKEKHVKAHFYDMLSRNLTLGNNVICDNTYLNPKTLNHLQNWLKEVYPNSKQEIVDFTHIHPNECIDRDKIRGKNGGRSVGWEVIWKMYCEYLIPKSIPFDSNKDNTIICDLDGTLCNLNGRNPYDTSTCQYDLPNIMVRDILIRYQLPICLVSGRCDKFRENTLSFLKTNVPSLRHHLFMRKDGDTRKDWIVKKEIFDNKIKPKYNILFALDDRNSVIRMWKAEGIQVFSVGPGYEF